MVVVLDLSLMSCVTLKKLPHVAGLDVILSFPEIKDNVENGVHLLLYNNAVSKSFQKAA